MGFRAVSTAADAIGRRDENRSPKDINKPEEQPQAGRKTRDSVDALPLAGSEDCANAAAGFITAALCITPSAAPGKVGNRRNSPREERGS
jgi:hypothetical protein